jgi:RNA polymerase sigma factor (TIGR02999 family)
MGEQEISDLLTAWRGGDPDAIHRLMPLVYDELRRRAHRRFTADRGTLQTTALVHEAYMKLTRHSHLEVQDRQHFFAVAAKAMRQIVLDHARAKSTAKRGGPLRVTTFDESEVAAETHAADIIAVDEALERLAALDEHLARIVELRFFAGLSVEETAEVLECSARTVKREWRKARAFLSRELASSSR